ncbi:toll-interacting protein-like [Sarcoptes scabiei]|nr:toll-interacting protein-like [Sarcoptes scabiei]
MSNYLNYDENDLCSEDEDALNYETFGCDINDINDDWEEEHEKYVVETSGCDDSCVSEKSSMFIDTGSFVETAPITNNTRDTFNYQSSYHPNSSSTPTNVSAKKNQSLKIDEVFPLCDDLIAKSVLDVVYDDNDEIFNPSEFFKKSDLLSSIQNGIDLKDAEAKLKEKAKNIDLESLRPPSPSILPLDHTFMSSVWRPPSPESASTTPSTSNGGGNDEIVNEDQYHSPNLSSPRQFISPRSNNLEGLGDENVARNQKRLSNLINLEDLESNLSAIQNTAKSKDISSRNSPNRLDPNILELLRLESSNEKISIEQQNYAKIVQPPPGFNLAQFQSPSSNLMQSPRNQIQMGLKPRISNSRSPLPMPIQDPKASILGLLNSSFSPQMLANQSQQSSTIQNQSMSIPTMEMIQPFLQQQRIISKIITPSQVQKSYRHLNHFHQKQDKFAGFMTQKEKDWLMKIFRIQCKVNDPYVEDYYEVTFMMRKKSQKLLSKSHNNGDYEMNGRRSSDTSDSSPMLVLPQTVQTEENKPRFIQFDDALGKIQVLNSRCPRKLVEFDEKDVSFHNYQLDRKSQCLLRIENLYKCLLDIEDEDKRLPILPPDVQQEHRTKRSKMCEDLFEALTVVKPNERKEPSQYFITLNRFIFALKRIDRMIDPKMVSIKKGLILIARTLSHMENDYCRIIILSSLIDTETIRLIEMIEEELKISLEDILIETIRKIHSAQTLIYLVSQCQNFDVFTDRKLGQQILMNLLRKYEKSEDKLKFIYFWYFF